MSGKLVPDDDLSIFSPIESRLVAIVAQLMPQMIVSCRLSADGIQPLTIGTVSTATRLALAAAVELDDELRRLRTQLSKIGGAA